MSGVGTLLVPALLVFLAAAAGSTLITGRVLRYALARGVLDAPGARSSHLVATPRGGGLAIVLVALLALPLFGFGGLLPWSMVIGLGGACALVGSLGWIDDHRHLGAGLRLSGHGLAALWGLFWLGGLPAVALPWGEVDLGLAGEVFAVLYLVWLLNLYNFMDGINGIAGVEALTVGLAMTVLLVGWGEFAASLPWLVLAGASLGFLPWNFPRAKIFLGDVGSGTIGLFMALHALYCAGLEPALLWAFLIMLAVFWVDATWTLLRRALRGERVYEAHRTHGYQRLARRLGGHAAVTLGVGLINVCWLFPLAASVAWGMLSGWLGLAVAVVPLVLAAWWLDAGAAEAS
jgi:Fuc2NAc and GlcNAc transferase